MVTSTGVETPALYMTTIGHTRTRPFRHAFRYRHPMWLVDVADASRPMPGIAGKLVCFDARDHLGDPGRSIHHNVVEWVAERGIDVRSDRIVMLANARTFGYAFSPLTIFWCLRSDGSARCIVAEVHNTYGGTHGYLLRPDAEGRTRVDKAFRVSPFNPDDGEYLMRVSRPTSRVRVDIVLRRGGKTTLSATLSGRRRPATARNVAMSLAHYPAASLRVSALIRFQGIRLLVRGLRRQVEP